VKTGDPPLTITLKEAERNLDRMLWANGRAQRDEATILELILGLYLWLIFVLHVMEHWDWRPLLPMSLLAGCWFYKKWDDHLMDSLFGTLGVSDGVGLTLDLLLLMENLSTFCVSSWLRGLAVIYPTSRPSYGTGLLLIAWVCRQGQQTYIALRRARRRLKCHPS
jgi:hypothetical protein